MILSESYKNRLQELAGITEAIEGQRYAGSEKRVPFNKEMMIQAIKEGREMGLSFQSNNDRYKMPTTKWRVIYPVAMGLSKKGNLVIRAFHKYGQSEKEALRTGKRSAEVENTWRLFKASNIKAMWFTGNFFRGPLEKYNAGGDAGMVNIEVQANFNEIIKFQDNFINGIKDTEQQNQKRKNIVHLFKDTGERPVEQPIQNPGTQQLPQKPKKPVTTMKPKSIKKPGIR